MSVLKNITAYYIKTKDIQDPILKEKVEKDVLDVFQKNFEPGDEKYVAFGEDDFMYLFVEDYKVKSVLNYLLENDLVVSHRDVTDEIISGEIYDDVDFKSIYETTDEYELQFKKVFDTFILKNVSPDNVLDKINEKGIESLTDVDKEILKNG